MPQPTAPPRNITLSTASAQQRFVFSEVIFFNGGNRLPVVTDNPPLMTNTTKKCVQNFKNVLLLKEDHFLLGRDFFGGGGDKSMGSMQGAKY